MVFLVESLETIRISYCNSLKTIVPKENSDLKIKFPKLRLLALESLRNFTGVYSNDQDNPHDDTILFNEEVEMPNLDSLELSSMDMKVITSQSRPFENLTKLNLRKCHRMQYLFSFPMAKSMKKLKSLSVCECDSMEDIFKYEDDGDMHEARKIRVFPKLEELYLASMEKLTKIWPSEANPSSFPSLNSISINWCHQLVTVLPSQKVGGFSRLESLKVDNCDSVEHIFDINITVAYETHLKVLQIESLRKLKHIWNNRDPEAEGILNFKRLHSIKVTSCDEMEYLFPVSVARDLQELDSFSVSSCHEMEEIVACGGDEGSSKVESFEFPKVSVVEMKVLPKLMCFYKGEHSVKWPNLKKLSVSGCDLLEAFKTETQNSGGPMFLPKEVIPNLETMEMSLMK